jgi:hypothetical protein
MLREKILALSQLEARKLGIGKSTLHYLRRKASDSARSFRVYGKVRKKLESAFRVDGKRRKKGRKGIELRKEPGMSNNRIS